VHAIAGEKIEEYVALGSVKFSARAERVFGLHLQQIEKQHPLWINVIDVGLNGGRFLRGCCHGRSAIRKRNMAA
jgi:hypothetical protein